jgi:hypothetical protein
MFERFDEIYKNRHDYITSPHIFAMYIFSFSGKVFKSRKEKGVLRKTLIEMG